MPKENNNPQNFTIVFTITQLGLSVGFKEGDDDGFNIGLFEGILVVLLFGVTSSIVTKMVLNSLSYVIVELEPDSPDAHDSATVQPLQG